jgi:hypothetical protein
MSVHGEFRRLLGDLIAVLRDAGVSRDTVSALEPLLERSRADLPGAAASALALLPKLDASALPDTALRRRFEDAFERADAVCRVILGR